MNQKATILIVSGNIDSKNARDCLNYLKANTSLQLIREEIVIEAGIRPDFNHAEEINRKLPIFKGDYLVLLDDDVVLKAGWLDGLRKQMRDSLGITDNQICIMGRGRVGGNS